MAEPKKGHTAKDGEKPASKPLEKAHVHVDATPNNAPGAGPLSHQIDKALKKDLETVIKEAKPKGGEKQLEAAEEAARKIVKEKVDPNTITKVRVNVSGEIDGKPVEKKLSVEPGTGKDVPPKT